MFSSRLSLVVRLGLWSTAVKTKSPSIANVMGTRCGPSVAIRATRAEANSRRASAASTPVVLDEANGLVDPPLRLARVDRRDPVDGACDAVLGPALEHPGLARGPVDGHRDR